MSIQLKFAFKGLMFYKICRLGATLIFALRLWVKFCGKRLWDFEILCDPSHCEHLKDGIFFLFPISLIKTFKEPDLVVAESQSCKVKLQKFVKFSK